MLQKLRTIIIYILLPFLLNLTSIIYDVYSEDVNPNIYSRFPDQNDLLPGGDFLVYYEIDDTTSGINTSSHSLSLQKWDGVSMWGSDISGTYVSGSSVTSTGATYNVLNLPYGKYRNTFSISDNDANTTTVSTIFYVDEPELIISTGSLNIGSLEQNMQTFSDSELIVTVRTLGAGFDVDMLKSSLLELDPTNQIIDWDTNKGFGYEQAAYSGSIQAINSTENIASQTGSINTNGDKNQYEYRLKYGALYDNIEQAAGDYEVLLDFRIVLNYSDTDNRCRLNGISTFACDI